MSGHSSRLEWVDAAKGISIILVVMMYSVFNVGQDAEGVGLFHYVIGFATPFRMPEFFLISGLFLSQVIDRDWRRFADRRVVHYLYFYALWAVIHLVVKVGIGSGAPLEALREIALAAIEPYGVLWFIYLLAVFSAATKLFHAIKVPVAAGFIFGAGLQMANVATGSYLVDQFCHYFVFFYSGYAFAPMLFKLVDWVEDGHRAFAVASLAVYAVINASLVFSPGYAVLPNHIQMGIAAFPGVHLLLALIGSVALCVTAALLVRLPLMGWLRWLGERSLAVYLAFVLPMSFSRVLLNKLGIVTDITTISLIVMVTAIGASLALHYIVTKTGIARFLFERPIWAHLPGTPGSRNYPARIVPAE